MNVGWYQLSSGGGVTRSAAGIDKACTPGCTHCCALRTIDHHACGLQIHTTTTMSNGPTAEHPTSSKPCVVRHCREIPFPWFTLVCPTKGHANNFCTFRVCAVTTTQRPGHLRTVPRRILEKGNGAIFMIAAFTAPFFCHSPMTTPDVYRVRDRKTRPARSTVQTFAELPNTVTLT